MIRVGIIGCGKIADAHAEQIRHIKGARLVGACDKEELMARQLCDRYEVDNYFDDIDVFLRKARPDVIHITTPPQSHYELGRKCLSAGCNVYVEKPFTMWAEEAEELLSMATGEKLRITVGHDDQFTTAARRMRKMIQDGYLGGQPVHMESCYCYDLGEPGYAKALLGDKSHWVRGLPGGLLQNIISHGIARISEHLTDDNPEVAAMGFVSPFLMEIQEYDIIDELRVMIKDGGGMTAYFTFSSQMRPVLHQFRIYGCSNGLILDHDQQTLIKMRGRRYKSYLEKFVPPIEFAKQYMANNFINMKAFLRNDFHMKSGMKYLIESFYQSIRYDAPVPIPYGEIIRTSKIMDTIFKLIYGR
jgi:predicted dehydrogenase